MTTPVVLVTGIDPEAMATVMVGLQWDLPRAVAVRHHIDVERQVLERVVSDPGGVVEHAEIELGHACVSCALREDVIPTLERVARDPRWASVIAHLPVGAPARQVCAAVAQDSGLARHLEVASVVTSLAGPGIVDDLLGDDLLRERGLHSGHDDARGVGEVASAMVEYADVVVLSGPATRAGVDLVRALGRPDLHLVEASDELDAQLVSARLHRHALTFAWVAPVRVGELPGSNSPTVWSLDLRSPRPFHPERLLARLEGLAGGRHRSRGCFWLPTRPDRALVWDGAGGQLSIGTGEPWGHRSPFTRIVLTGTGTPPDALRDHFDAMLLQRDEPGPRGGSWELPDDGFEAWLGPIRSVA